MLNAIAATMSDLRLKIKVRVSSLEVPKKRLRNDSGTGKGRWQVRRSSAPSVATILAPLATRLGYLDSVILVG